MSEHIICIGSSAASLACATYLRRLDKRCRITMLTAQQEQPYNTCLLSDYVAGNRDRASLFMPIPEQVTIIYNARVKALHRELKKVITPDGEYFYDKLFIGIGLAARIPAWAQAHLYTKVFPYKTLRDVDIIRAHHIHDGARVLVVGGGLTGIELCQALVPFGYSVTLAEKNDRLAQQDACELLRDAGVTVLLNCEVAQGDSALFDIIFLATGGVPATDFLQGQLVLDEGFIVVDGTQQTSDGAICAGGDCVRGRTLWRDALHDGTRAARTMLLL